MIDRVNLLNSLKNKLKKRCPFLKKELRSIISELEWKKSDWNILELSEYPELKRSAWLGLGGIAFEIVRHFEPKTIVELGTHMGFSALTMALALKKNKIPGKVYAVDSWEGDAHAGYYPNSVYETLKERIATMDLGNNIELVRKNFKEAKDCFEKIDLLHIDGLHTYQAVSDDFNTYKDKLLPGSLVLFHDVNTQFAEMRKLWNQLEWQFETALIPYSHGLGVLRIN